MSITIASPADWIVTFVNGVVLGVDQAKLRAAIDESCAHLFNAAGYKPDPFSESFKRIHPA